MSAIENSTPTENNLNASSKVQTIPSISAEVQEPGQHCSALPHDSLHCRDVRGHRSGAAVRPALCRAAVPRRISFLSSIVSNENYQRETGTTRLGSAMHAASCAAFAQRRLTCVDHVHSQAVSGKSGQAGPVTLRCSVCTISTTQQNFAPIARSEADVWANANRSELTDVSEETSSISQNRTIYHKKSAKAIRNKGQCMKNVVLSEINNAANVNTRLMPKLADIYAYFKEYCDAAGLHGVRYLSEDHRNSFERVFWCVTLILCAVGAATMIMKIKGKLDTTPVVVTFAETETNIWHLPFPAVTLCPYTKVEASLFNLKKFAKKFRYQEDFLDDYISLLEKIESKIESSDRLFYQVNGSSMWVKEIFSKRLYNDLYGDSLSEELTVLLEQMLQNNGSLFPTKATDDICYATSFSQGVSPPEDNALCKSIRKYYPVWINENKQKMLALGPFCHITVGWWEETFKNSSFILDESAKTFFAKVSPSSPPIYTSWHFGFLPTADAWKETWTDQGRCFTFNMINNGQIYRENVFVCHEISLNESETGSSWHPDRGYSAEAGPHTYPRRSFSADPYSGLLINIREKTADIDYTCNVGRTGYKVILHRPEDQPHGTFDSLFTIPFDRHATIYIKPTVLTTSSVLEKYDARTRQCYLSHEKHLKYFKFYTKNNCLLECLTNATLRKCGCVAFYMPRNASTKMCNAGLESCLVAAAEEIELRDMNEHLKNNAGNDAGTFKSQGTKTECDCLPSCLSIFYEAESSIIKMSSESFDVLYTRPKEDAELNKSSLTIANFKFKFHSFMARQRSELYGQVDFLANCGGFLGLFCGFSLISLIELVYFLTIRLWSNIIRRSTNITEITQKSRSA